VADTIRICGGAAGGAGRFWALSTGGGSGETAPGSAAIGAVSICGGLTHSQAKIDPTIEQQRQGGGQFPPHAEAGPLRLPPGVFHLPGHHPMRVVAPHRFVAVCAHGLGIRAEEPFEKSLRREPLRVFPVDGLQVPDRDPGFFRNLIQADPFLNADRLQIPAERCLLR
jgi:hypothetical protein